MNFFLNSQTLVEKPGVTFSGTCSSNEEDSNPAQTYDSTLLIFPLFQLRVKSSHLRVRGVDDPLLDDDPLLLSPGCPPLRGVPPPAAPDHPLDGHQRDAELGAAGTRGRGVAVRRTERIIK